MVLTCNSSRALDDNYHCNTWTVDYSSAERGRSKSIKKICANDSLPATGRTHTLSPMWTTQEDANKTKQEQTTFDQLNTPNVFKVLVDTWLAKRRYNWSCIALFCAHYHSLHYYRNTTQLFANEDKLTFKLTICRNALRVKGGPWIKRCKKLAKVDLRFSSKKNHQFIFTALFEFLMSHIFHRKNWMTSVQKYDQNYNKSKKGWSRLRWATIFCKMKIWTMPRKKAQNSVAQRDRLQGEI